MTLTNDKNEPKEFLTVEIKSEPSIESVRASFFVFKSKLKALILSGILPQHASFVMSKST